MTENSSFLPGLSRRYDRTLKCYIPGQILVKALEKVVHEGNVTRHNSVTRSLPFHNQKKLWGWQLTTLMAYPPSPLL